MDTLHPVNDKGMNGYNLHAFVQYAFIEHLLCASNYAKCKDTKIRREDVPSGSLVLGESCGRMDRARPLGSENLNPAPLAERGWASEFFHS